MKNKLPSKYFIIYIIRDQRTDESTDPIKTIFFVSDGMKKCLHSLCDFIFNMTLTSFFGLNKIF